MIIYNVMIMKKTLTRILFLLSASFLPHVVVAQVITPSSFSPSNIAVTSPYYQGQTFMNQGQFPVVFPGELPSFSFTLNTSSSTINSAITAYEMKVVVGSGSYIGESKWDSGKIVLNSPLYPNQSIQNAVSETPFYILDKDDESTAYQLVTKFWDQYGIEHDWSAQVDPPYGIFYVTYVDLPAPPHDFTLFNRGTGEVGMYWYDNAFNETGYKIERSSDMVNYVQIASLATDSNSYVDSGLTSSTTYSYRISSYNGAGFVSYSTSSITTLKSNESIYRVYTDPTKDVIFVASNFEPNGQYTGWELLRNATSSPISTGEYDVGVWASESQMFRTFQVINMNQVPTSSEIVSATLYEHQTADECTGPSGPDLSLNCKSTIVKSNSLLDPANITETDYDNFTNTALSDKKFDSKSPEYLKFNGYSRFPLNQSGLVALENRGLVAVGFRSGFDIDDVNPNGWVLNHLFSSSLSDQNVAPYVEITVSAVVATPTPPTDFIGVPLSTSTVVLAWTDNASNEDAYVLERSLNAVNYSIIATTTSDISDFTDSGLNPGVKYYYRLRAFNSVGYSSSVTTSIVTLPTPPSPSTALEVDKQTNPIGVNKPKPQFSAIFQDALSTALATSYEIQIAKGTANFTNLYWDTGKTSFGNTTPVGTRTKQVHSGAIFPRDGSQYFWRIRLWDQFNNEGEWSAETASFTMK